MSDEDDALTRFEAFVRRGNAVEREIAARRMSREASPRAEETPPRRSRFRELAESIMTAESLAAAKSRATLMLALMQAHESELAAADAEDAMTAFYRGFTFVINEMELIAEPVSTNQVRQIARRLSKGAMRPSAARTQENAEDAPRELQAALEWLGPRLSTSGGSWWVRDITGTMQQRTGETVVDFTLRAYRARGAS